MPIKPIENLTKRKSSGGKRKQFRGRRAYELKGYASETTLGETKIFKKSMRGGKLKPSLRKVSVANALDPSTKKVTKVKILKVVKNPANRDYERRGVITKGAIIETELGTARVVSRPGQDSLVNVVLIK